MVASGNFAKQLFISYAHLDNQKLTPEQEGWVSRFHASLDAMLSMRLGRKAGIWRDGKLTGTDIFADEIVSQFPSTALLISIVTPRYVESEWCTREVHEFCEAAQRTGSLVVENKSRVIKVIKTPVESEEHLPQVMRDTLGYAFYIRDEDTPLELDAAYGPEMAQKYNLKVAKLAWDIAQLLRTLETVDPRRLDASTSSEGKPTVFLADCGYDRRDAREAIEADLRLSGYTVLPEKALPMDEAAHVAAVTELLATCSLSVHVIGSSYGVVPDGSSGKSVVVLQNELAMRRSREAGLRRVIWSPEGTISTNAAQQEFISALHTNAELQLGADLVTADLETFKSVVHAALKKLEKPVLPGVPPSQDSASRVVYLICDERDRADTIPLRKLLKARGFTVKIPLFEGPSATLRQANDELLSTCEAAMIFYGTGDESWKRTVEADLKKARAIRGSKTLPPVFTYLAGPATPDKRELIELDERDVINGIEGLVEATMGPFLVSLGEEAVR
jgi:hypothetical protein